MVPRLQIIGGGKMGEALLSGLLARGWAQVGEIRVVEKLPDRAGALQKAFPGLTVAPESSVADGHLVAVKPDDVDAVCRALAGERSRTRVLSIAAGVTLARLEAALGPDTPVVRAMPNTPALVGAGVAAIAPGQAASDEDLAWAESILGAVGTVVRLDESLLDAVTGLSGSGPAYVFLVVESLIEGGVLNGLPRPVASTLAIQTVLGAARLLTESDEGPEALRAAVTSPAGTTAAGLRELESAGVRSAFLDAITAATARSKELGEAQM
jgi:pyrroline-5-carboxylate reductase